MFEDSLVESSGRLKTGRGWRTTVSMVGQLLLIGIMILIPLIYTEALPPRQLVTVSVAPPLPPPPPPPAAVVKVTKIETELDNGQLRTPTKIPEKVKIIKEEEAPPSTGIMGGVQGGVPGGALSGVLGGIIGSANIPKVAAPSRIRVSQGVTEGNLVRKVQPNYPPLAKTARIQGQVILHALISKAGNIENLEVVSGHPMLVQSALDAVKQ